VPARYKTAGSAIAVPALLLLAAVSVLAAAKTEPSVPSSPPDKLMIEGKVMGVRVPPKPGDVCLIDGKKLRPGDPVYLIVNGYRIPLHWPDCYFKFTASPREWLSRLEPGGGAFLGSEVGSVGGDRMWIWIGLYVLCGLIFAGICSQRSLEAGYTPASGFALGFFLNVVGYLILTRRPRRPAQMPDGIPAGLRKIHATYSPQTCPVCGFPNHPAATACTHCGTVLTARVVSEVVKVHLIARDPEQ
jgi:hypothetical protein